MIILSHRGYWLNVAEKNTREAFERSFSLGFGTETDIRDFEGRLVISHDPANHDCMPLESFFEIYLQYPTRPTLALNIKADGLQKELLRLTTIFGIEDYFVFDMAVPDGLHYLKSSMPTYTRHSEYEPIPPYYALAQGVWLDEFDSHWLTDEVVENHLAIGKKVCIVSPELHKRSYETEWAHYKKLDKKLESDNLALCTDLPKQAEEFFNA